MRNSIALNRFIISKLQVRMLYVTVSVNLESLVWLPVMKCFYLKENARIYIIKTLETEKKCMLYLFRTVLTIRFIFNLYVIYRIFIESERTIRGNLQ